MTITTAIRESAARIGRRRQKLTELRIDEIESVRSIATDYHAADRQGDLDIERHFQALYSLVDTEAEKEAVAAAFAVWIRDERIEELAVSTSVDESVELLKANNPAFLADGCGPDGRAA